METPSVHLNIINTGFLTVCLWLVIIPSFHVRKSINPFVFISDKTLAENTEAQCNSEQFIIILQSCKILAYFHSDKQTM